MLAKRKRERENRKTVSPKDIYKSLFFIFHDSYTQIKKKLKNCFNTTTGKRKLFTDWFNHKMRLKT